MVIRIGLGELAVVDVAAETLGEERENSLGNLKRESGGRKQVISKSEAP